ncbi:isocitrate lyase/phosphoenolpyruvate mutase family protein, partial [Mucilaginibacter sp.]|uniref:isocitrate lyase/phosphoenolpyruvate mutase family protein n=1 Tax=Mucilaginibacter sp. TaxID=1882438 RepID=UPI002603EAA7
HSVARIKAAVKAARSLPDPFMLTARAENFLHGRIDLKDTIRRLEAYADAGADVLYAPGLTTLEEVDAVVRAVSPKPVNVLLSVNKPDFTLDALAKLGVKRVSVGSLLARVAYGSFFTAAQELQQKGTFNFVENAIGYADINNMFK